LEEMVRGAEYALRAAVDIYKAESSEDDGEIVKGGKYL
jgi:hypothetical protein